MIKKIINILSKTKIAFIGLLLVLIPVIILSYKNYISLPEKSAVLKSSFDLSATLMHNNIETEVNNFQEHLVSQIKKLPVADNRKRMIEALRAFEKSNPLLSRCFLLKKNQYAVSSVLSSGWSNQTADINGINPMFNEEILSAEKQEFAEKNLPGALSVYNKILFYSSPESLRLYENDNSKRKKFNTADSIFLFSRIARCYYKLQQYSSAIKYYNRIIELDKGNFSLAGLSVSVAALQQISDSYRESKDMHNYYNTQLRLFNYLYSNPADPVDNFYIKILHSAKKELEKDNAFDLNSVEIFEKELINSESYLKYIRKIFGEYRIFNELSKDDGLKSYSINSNSDSSIIYYKLRNDLIFGFNIDRQRLFKNLMPILLKKTKTDDDVMFSVLDNRQDIIYSNNPSGYTKNNPGFLASKTMAGIISGWKIILSNKEGKTISQLADEDKNEALLLLTGAVLVMLAGIIIIVRSAIKEIEISQMKSDFVSNVSHELKTPLTMIRMFSETLDSDLKIDEARRQEFTHIIKKESERLTQLVNNILDFSRIEQKTRSYSRQKTNITYLIKNITDNYRTKLCEQGFTFTVKLPAYELTCTIDKEAISRVIINLLNNAEKYSDINKEINVCLENDNNSVLIRIEDKGIGIPQKDLNKIFERFYRSANSEKLAIGGTGLGLTIARQIIESHNGRIEVESIENKGSCFTIILPVSYS